MKLRSVVSGTTLNASPLPTTNAVGIAYRRMPAYKSKISTKDRWAIVSYIRALQYSQLGKLEEVDPGKKAELEAALESK